MEEAILALVSEAEKKLSQPVIEKIISKKLISGKDTVRKSIKKLINDGKLFYTYLYGNSYLENSFSRPVFISKSVVVKPYNLTYSKKSSEIVIDIFPGISFGAGDHPTTRLSVQAIESSLLEKKLTKNFSKSSVLDIGTGTGILALAALKFGFQKGVGVDIDPCSRIESQKNAAINGLENRLQISGDLEKIKSKFDLITANLRLPDIMKIYPLVIRYLNHQGVVILSGIRPHEIDPVINKYTDSVFNCISVTNEKNWSCLVLITKKGI